MNGRTLLLRLRVAIKPTATRGGRITRLCLGENDDLGYPMLHRNGCWLVAPKNKL